MSPQGAGTWVSTEMVETLICDRWPLLLPEHRAIRPEWPWWEWPRMASMRANLRTGDVLWDVGTEEGDQSAIYAQWVSGRGPKGAGGIVLIEPNTLVWANVKAIFEANDVPPPIASVVAFAADRTSTQRPEIVTLGWPSCADGPLIGDHGFLHLAEHGALAHRSKLDDLATQTARVDAITIDIEGSELVALRGADDILLRERPLVWVSIHPAELAEYHGHTRADVIDYMAGHGYGFEHLAAEHELHTFFYPAERGHDVVLPYGGKW